MATSPGSSGPLGQAAAQAELARALAAQQAEISQLTRAVASQAADIARLDQALSTVFAAQAERNTKFDRTLAAQKAEIDELTRAFATQAAEIIELGRSRGPAAGATARPHLPDALHTRVSALEAQLERSRFLSGCYEVRLANGEAWYLKSMLFS